MRAAFRRIRKSGNGTAPVPPAPGGDDDDERPSGGDEDCDLGDERVRSSSHRRRLRLPCLRKTRGRRRGDAEVVQCPPGGGGTLRSSVNSSAYSEAPRCGGAEEAEAVASPARGRRARKQTKESGMLKRYLSQILSSRNCETPVERLSEQRSVWTDGSGPISIFVSGPRRVEDQSGIVLAVYRFGYSYHYMNRFFESKTMVEAVGKHLVFVYVTLPGQEYGSVDVPCSFPFPSLDQIVDDICKALLTLNVTYCVAAIGDGLGSDVIVRFAHRYPNYCLALLLVNIQLGHASAYEACKCHYKRWMESKLSVMESPEVSLLFEVFYDRIYNDWISPDRCFAPEDFMDLRSQLDPEANPFNMKKLLEVYVRRSSTVDILSQVQVSHSVLFSDTLMHTHSLPSVKNQNLVTMESFDSETPFDLKSNKFLSLVNRFFSRLGCEA